MWKYSIESTDNKMCRTCTHLHKSYITLSFNNPVRVYECSDGSHRSYCAMPTPTYPCKKYEQGSNSIQIIITG